MSQNISHAVMAQRHEAHDSLDFFPTPPWATRALCEHVIGLTGMHVAFDPACGDGAMVRPLAEYFMKVFASDVHDYGKGFEVQDFLFPRADLPPCDWVITNPPFRLAEQFIKRGLEIAECGVAVLVRSVFMESVGRYQNLFKPNPPAVVAQFVERVPMVKGRLDREASSATSYAWMVWTRRGERDARGMPQEPSTEPTRLVWIPPCRKKLEKASDYT